jgi:hypothetical protein
MQAVLSEPKFEVIVHSRHAPELRHAGLSDVGHFVGLLLAK